ncbi:RHS repeat protein [Collimonas sp. NPDC087041]|uniref:RHS repeat protein n=1 Tax=Collimonas sp. NPDC087041 TaxID=3363960 RepID=UPI0037FB04F1
MTQQVDGSGNTLGFTYVNENDEVERYDVTGKLLSITNHAGLTQTLQYAIDPHTSLGILIGVTDAFGRQLRLTYDAQKRLSAITDPNGGSYTYTYDGKGNLSTVTYPDNRTRQYVYENTAYLNALTGIIDENGLRFATWSYDSQGNAISSEHAVGVEKVTLTYPTAANTIATDAGGATRTYATQVINGIAKAGSINEVCGVNCNRSLLMNYDANGNVTSRTDYNGAVTTYSYDLIRDLETSRVEASGTAQARTITTAWHATYRLPLQIAEPKLLTTYTYDASGNLLSKTVQATSDAAGAQGLSPTLVGTARTWSYTYNTVGQVLTATGPRTDVADTTTYTYDTSGNLSTITNAVGQVTTLSNYDANGRVGLITDTNGTTTALTYSPRGWLTGKTVTANGTVQTTSYSYDGVGQLTQVVLPDASTVNYTYDPAHRLTNIADSLGNNIAYTLDNMGNRISEQVKDPSGALARQTSRVVDALNRLQQITGAVQ